jgi:hypothetical protein
MTFTHPHPYTGERVFKPPLPEPLEGALTITLSFEPEGA